jgi:2-polyprenyl-3-methyl-5-hydroxy-6-metoxy-1,4-benzoquinol methylase
MRDQAKRLVRRLKAKMHLVDGREVELLRDKVEFLLGEVARINECRHEVEFGQDISADAEQTKASFDYQWAKLPSGKALPDDPQFRADLANIICRYCGLEPQWFKGKNVIDVGCGSGRFTYGLLSLGARVTACDQSQAALGAVKELCQEYAANLQVKQFDLLDWPDDGSRYDLVYCFGVVHHTGNTYRAIYNVARAVKDHGGRLFLMAYGYPRGECPVDFKGAIAYEQYRKRLRFLTFDEKVQALKNELDADHVHGWFDAASPRINDLLTYEELVNLLHRCGLTNVRSTVDGHNHHVVAEKL